ncbi:hypothetical protein GCM10017083_24550 [Thalassobaculum fulvum]|uniref:Uncharacterized protein n=1 Tax=Thalassobaculum fulvum TaxID=1633335 RepID=A0A918XRV1_9PROT|nr:hypothetical protein GCM10017083_24550 [Thalassobaculum fulvum]
MSRAKARLSGMTKDLSVAILPISSFRTGTPQAGRVRNPPDGMEPDGDCGTRHPAPHLDLPGSRAQIGGSTFPME